jgi:anti-anti-sigma factor
MNLMTNVVRYLDYRILVVSGEIDFSTGPALHAAIFRLLEESTLPLLIDMAAVTFCDSTGLNLAVTARRHAATHGGTLALLCLTEPVAKIFRITHLDQHIPIYKTRLDAVLDLLAKPA